jgi:hypothetical protein
MEQSAKWKIVPFLREPWLATVFEGGLHLVKKPTREVSRKSSTKHPAKT